jgi:hypothetical protein
MRLTQTNPKKKKKKKSWRETNQQAVCSRD